MSRIIVIGAGVGGLAAAIRLAGAGHDVEVHERSGVAGGKLGGYERDGFRFDTGPSLLTLPQVFTDLELSLPLEPLDPVVRHFFPDGTVLDSSSNHRVFTDRIAQSLGAPAAADWERFWRRAARIWRASWRSVLRHPVTPATLAGLSWRLTDLAAIAPGRTLRHLGQRYFDDPRLRLLLDRYATYAGTDPRRAPAALAAIPYAELAFGGWYLPGGLTTLAAAMVARCEALGVRLVFDSEVTGIATSGGRATGVHAASGFRPADVIVSDVDALTLYRDLLPTPSRLPALTDRSLAGFVLLLGVRGETPGLAHHNVFFPPYYDAEFDAIFGGASRRARPADHPTIFVTRPADPAVHPPGCESWFVLVNAPRHGTAWSAVDWRRPGLADAYAEHILRLLARAGVDVRDRLLFLETRTPADLAATTAAPGGAIYGTTGGLLRPPNQGPLPNLHLVGGSAHPGGGLPLVTLSAEIAATQIDPA
ncbi:phytoene desaturase family protein [Actinoplanes sp. KI2]|uniref:phytoene desaturase family protein n=1 Tax=Actinoplanes sp. KI2 TaxID=2983315 RepID=UPI0021D60C21|nr:phytoene desaturase family protein [Actinoplanes sp. KI2]MCU7731103.1 phytoene desaturase family protein [Actinoplanes sp. KI2]